MEDSKEIESNDLKERIYNCGMCVKFFITSKALEMHIKAIHETKKQTFKCDFCGTFLSRADGLRMARNGLFKLLQ